MATDLARLQAFIDKEFQFNHIIIESVGEGRARVRLKTAEHHLRPGGTVSGPALMTLADEFSLQPILIGGQESWKVTDKLAERRMPVILQRNTPGSARGSERTRVSGDMAARLQAAGIPFCLSGGDLLEQIRFAVRYGLEEKAALAAVTSSPAAILGIDDRVGTIQAGRDADFVALDGPPLEFTTAITWVMVAGVIQFEQAGN